MEFSVLDLDSLNDFDFYQMRQFDDVFSPEPIPDDSRHGDHHKVEEERRQLDYSPLSSKVEDSSLVFNLQSPAAAITSPPTSLFSMQRQHCGEILPSDAGRCSTSSAASPADPTVSVSGCCFAPAADAKDADNIDVKPVSARRGRKRLPETVCEHYIRDTASRGIVIITTAIVTRPIMRGKLVYLFVSLSVIPLRRLLCCTVADSDRGV